MTDPDRTTPQAHDQVTKAREIIDARELLANAREIIDPVAMAGHTPEGYRRREGIAAAYVTLALNLVAGRASLADTSAAADNLRRAERYDQRVNPTATGDPLDLAVVFRDIALAAVSLRDLAQGR